MLTFISNSFEDTINIAMEISKHLFAGSVVCLSGDLGVGKTAFTQGIGKGLGIKEYITSPTYTIINEYYSGRIPLYHFDVYRLENSEEMMELGCDEYLYGNGATVIEWADNVYDIIPDHRLWITISSTGEPDKRLMQIEAVGNKYKDILKELKKHENTCH
ncbi:MAG: tRNA (adenosine(37)-N6)-threonylcarbamoyltransferase complex ATPase subunit type 1 TsaE [Clostridiales bacterium]|jgi:tRNA threonylcarbamoyladenosine biosynthesis protein TsaE|nr:tRNA (adenosine(37)-N6)-threonylcarbamoyltransferase complex ATPase subunit type 1 TsaE [Clostridiales bacterium]